MDKSLYGSLFSNLALAARKLDQIEKSESLEKLSRYFEPAADAGPGGTLEELALQIDTDLKTGYLAVREKARAQGDRGALRAVTWGEKVSAVQKSFITRYQKADEAFLDNQDIYVCEACGFIFAGKQAPDICPVCKAPAKKFVKI